MITVELNDKNRLIKQANDLVDHCMVSLQDRTLFYRLMAMLVESGRADNRKCLINTIDPHLLRTAAHLYSPVELKFSIDFENEYPKETYAQAAVAAKSLTRQWNRQKTATAFGRGVYDALRDGIAIMKQWTLLDRNKNTLYRDRLVSPWQFGVYNEAETDINNQIALCEQMPMTMPEVWRRIWHLPDAQKLYRRILSHATDGSPVFQPESYVHQVLSTSQLNTTGVQGVNRPGGIVQLANDPNSFVMNPRIDIPTVSMFEIWVQDDADYTTIQLIEPDIIITPFARRENLLVPDLQPYRVIRPNEKTNYFWGKPDIINLIEPQGFLGDTCDDYKRLFGLQVDKILGFIGQSGMTDERFGKMKQTGWVNMGQGEDIKDLTPQVPNLGLDTIKFLIETISMLGGYPPILQGQGEPGVRAGVHADRLTKNASPTLRDRSLLVEQQLADCADLTLCIKEAKDHEFKWVDGSSSDAAEQSAFLLSTLPDDWRVTVDSHSSSPIFSDENTQLVFAAQGKGIVDEEYVIDNTPMPNKEQAKVSLRERKKKAAEQQQQLLKAHPEVAEKLQNKQLMHAIGGGKKK